MLKIKILTAFPEMFPGSLEYSLIGKALKEKKFTLETINLRAFGINERGNIDDEPFGGGPGMVLKPDVVEKALKSIKNYNDQKTINIYLTPSGRALNQDKLRNIANFEQIIILCGRFEGVDQRAIDILFFEEISIGDYILTGGEIAAQVLVEGCIRLIPGVLGQPNSLLEESFSNNLLEYPHYTRPKVWQDIEGNKHEVPNVLISGNHEKIKEWRKNKSINKTKFIRPDLIRIKKVKDE
tara:strand:- start:15845 stop:16561 length:717 start_codon:yes stop_codon:yes gene_type:complete